MKNTQEVFNFLSKKLSKTKRSLAEVIALSVWVSLIFFIPSRIDQATPFWNIVSLMIQKAIPPSLGILTAHASRCFLFPYIDLSDLLKNGHGWAIGFVGAWYVGIILAFSWGG